MSDELHHLLEHAGDEGPPEAFASSLRAIVLEEAARIDELTQVASLANAEAHDEHREASTSVDDSNVVEITLDYRTDERSESGRVMSNSLRWVAAAGIIAVVAIASVLAGLSDENGAELETITPPDTNTAEANITTTTVAAEVFEDVPDAAFNPAAAPIETRLWNFAGTERIVLEPGTYQSNGLGTPLSVELTEPFEVPINDAGLLVLDSEVEAVQAREIVISRISHFADPTQPDDLSADLDALWPTDDIEGWLDALSNTFSTTAPQRTTLGGFPAVTFELWATGTECDAGTRCGFFATNHRLEDIEVMATHRYEIWVIDQGIEDPIVIVIDDPRFDDSEWRARASELVSSIGFGQAEPNPVIGRLSDIDRAGFLDGVTLEALSDDVAVRNGPDSGSIPLDVWFAETRFLTRPSLLDGERVETADQLFAALTEEGVAISEIESTTVGGIDARVFDIEGPSQPLLSVGEGSANTWNAPAQARLWAIDHPERGLLIVSAEVRANVAVAGPLIIERTEELVANLEFIEVE